MNLTIPVVGTTVGPTWATQINTALETVSDHAHTSGNGSAITPSAININADLTFNGYAGTDAEYWGCSDQAAVLADANIAYAVYSVGGNLYWRTSGGTDVQITDGSGLNFSSLGVIGGDYGQPGVNASVLYTDSTKLYSFYQDSGITAAVLMGQLKLSNQVSGSNVVTIACTNPTANMTLTLPAALPGGQTFMQMASSGAISYSSTFSAAATFSSTLSVAGVLSAGTDGVAATMLFYGGATKFKADTTTGDYGLLGDRTQGSIYLSATDSGASARIFLYGNSHASLDGDIEFRSQSARTGLIDKTGSWSLGASGYTGTHTTNGALSVTTALSVGTTLAVTEAATLSSTLSAGASTLASLGVTGAATVGTTLGVTGATTLSSTLSAGASTLASLGVTGAATVGTTLGVTGNITASANVNLPAAAASYTAPRIRVLSTVDCAGIGVYGNSAGTPAGIGLATTTGAAFLYYTPDAGTTTATALYVTVGTGQIIFGASGNTSVHDLNGSLNLNTTGGSPANGIQRSATNQLSINTDSTERIRIGSTGIVTVRGALLAEGATTTIQGAIDANSTADFQGAVNFQASPTGAIAGGTWTATPTVTTGSAGSVTRTASYIRVGISVHCSVTIQVTTNGSGDFTFTLPLPVARTAGNFNSTTQASGVALIIGGESAQVFSSNGAQTVQVSATGLGATTAVNVQITFSYLMTN